MVDQEDIHRDGYPAHSWWRVVLPEYTCAMRNAAGTGGPIPVPASVA